MIKQLLLNWVIIIFAKLCHADHLLTTDKSRYFAQPCPEIVSYFFCYACFVYCYYQYYHFLNLFINNLRNVNFLLFQNITQINT